MKRVLLIPILVLLLLACAGYLLSGGAGVQAASSQRPIVVCSPDEIQSLDPEKMSWAADIRAAVALWEGLVDYDPKTLAPTPGVAKSWEIAADGKTYTFHLRADARWNNGDPVTAADFIFGWKRLLTPSTGADYIDLLKVVVGASEYTAALVAKKEPSPGILHVEAPDPLTLVVHLQSRCGYFLDLCAFPPLFPLHEASMRPYLSPDPAAGYDTTWTRPPHLVTNGPYQLVEWRFKQYLALEPNPHYWDRQNVKCGCLLLKSIPQDERAALLAFQTGTIDVFTTVPQGFGDDLLALQKRGLWPQVHYRPVFGSYYYIFNCASGPLKDKRVRKALSLAVDRREIVEKVTRMNQKPLSVLVPPDSIPGYESPDPPAEDVAEAKRLLAEAGYPEGQGLRPLSLVYTTDVDIHGRIAQAIAQRWKTTLGVDVEVRGLERASFHTARRQIDFDIARGGWYGDYTDPTTWLDLMRTGDGNNDGKFSDPAYDALLDAAAAEPDPVKRFAKLRDAETLIVRDELPLMPLYQYGDGFLYDEQKIRGFEANLRLITPLKWIHRPAPGEH